MPSEQSSSGRPAFVFSHGGRHGSWSWTFVLEELRTRGYEAVAIDLALADPTAGAMRFAQALAREVEALPRPVTLVGHSMSGLVIPLVPELTAVEELFFVCAPLPVPGLTLLDQLERTADRDLFVRDNLGPLLAARSEDLGDRERAHAIHTYYHDVPDELAAWAADRLRPQVSRVSDEASPLRRWPDVPCRYVLGVLDRIVNPAWARREVPRRLGVVPIELDTGHSPFLSRPAALVDALLGLSGEGPLKNL